VTGAEPIAGRNSPPPPMNEASAAGLANRRRGLSQGIDQ
jgi:hypothetical protein